MPCRSVCHFHVLFFHVLLFAIWSVILCSVIFSAPSARSPVLTYHLYLTPLVGTGVFQLEFRQSLWHQKLQSLSCHSTLFALGYAMFSRFGRTSTIDTFHSATGTIIHFAAE